MRFLCALVAFLTLGLSSPALAQTATAARPTSVDRRPAAGARSPRNANYTIEVQLDAAARRLRGHARIQWRNITGRPTRELQFHLYWNAWRNVDSTWLRERRLTGGAAPRADAFGSVDVSSLRVKVGNGSWADGMPRGTFIAPDDGNADDRTVFRVPLDSAVDPGGVADVDVTWTSRIPVPFARTGVIGRYYFIAQWFPKLGVLEENGWNTHQFHSATEFFADYGVYDVAITVPSAFTVGATGCALATGPGAAPCGTSVGTLNPDGTATHRFHAEDVHDFAWTASLDFVDLTRTFTHPTLPRTQVRLLLQPEHRGLADRYFGIVNATLARYGEWFGAYPYGYLTVVDPAFQSRSDGMEYPTLVTGRARWLAPADVQVPEMTTAHEVGHQWWYGMVGTNEFEHAWMDEGINTYVTARVMAEAMPRNRVEARFFGDTVPWPLDIPFSRIDNDRLSGYRENAAADVPSTPTWRYWPATATFISYNKTAVWLHTLERHLGWPTMRRVLATYFERWAFRHPRPDDFFAVLNEVSGQDMSWFVNQVFRTTRTFDYAVQDLQSDRTPSGTYRTTVVVRRLGSGTFPVPVVTRFGDGTSVTEQWLGSESRVVYTYERRSRATSAVVDPDRVLLLDLRYSNNSRSLTAPGRAASLKWALTWMAWLQQLLVSYGFFV